MDTSTIDLLALIGMDTPLKRAASHRGGEYHGPCPFCGGTDRFRVQPNHKGGRFVCRICGKSGDPIDYVRQTRDLTYPQALEYLGLQGDILQDSAKPSNFSAAPIPLVSPEDEWYALESDEWQRAADTFVAQCIDVIDGARGKRAREYLYRRGLKESIVNAHELGYNPTEQRQQWGDKLVWLPRGIVIPHHVNGQYWRINIRQENPRDPKSRYIQAAGGANALYNADCIYAGCTVIMVEGEIDCLSIYGGAIDSVIYNRIVPVATYTTGGAHLQRWIVRLSLAERVLLAFDNDTNGAGDKAAAWWLKVLGNKAQRLNPLRHDVNESLQLGDDLNAWVRSAAA